MAGRVAEALCVASLAAALTAAVAITAVRAPTERVFGMAIVGAHHDPFTVMAHFDGAPRAEVYWQPVTDVPGALVARVAGGIAAYNWIVLFSFPMAAATAFLLARHLSLSRAGATLAALAYAFSPFHFAHAAYHAHIAQVQWIPLYLLALWQCLDRASVARIALLAGATAAVALSNFYGGLIAAVITPVAMGARALIRRAPVTYARPVAITAGVLAALAAAGAAFAVYQVGDDRTSLAFQTGDIARYSATLLSFLTPPVAHPWFGAPPRAAWDAAGVGLVEQQLFLGWSVIALALIGTLGWADDRRGYIPVLWCVAAVALFIAVAPPMWLHDALPMFRSYARFGVVVQLMVALLAGIGFDRLWRNRTPRWRMAAAGLAILIAGEYAVSPAAMSRPVPARYRVGIEAWHRTTEAAR
jgi:hypothetical protein